MNESTANDDTLIQEQELNNEVQKWLQSFSPDHKGIMDQPLPVIGSQATEIVIKYNLIISDCFKEKQFNKTDNSTYL